MKNKHYLLIFLLLFVFSNIFSQKNTEDDALIYDNAKKAISDAVASLNENDDPYGFVFSVKVTKKEGTDAVFYPFDASSLRALVEELVVGEQHFERFNLESEVNVYDSKPGILYVSVGLAPYTAPQIGYQIYSLSVDLKSKQVGSALQRLTAHIGASFVIKKPANGGVEGHVYYKDESGNDAKWNKEKFPTSPYEQWLHVRYRRLGPGKGPINSGEQEPQSDWVRIGSTSEYSYSVSNRDPGHFFPSVKLRGCLQRYENLEQDKELEAIVKLKNRLNWNNLHNGANGEATPDENVEAEKVTGKDIYTEYSLKNTVKGKVLDVNNNPVKGKKTVILEPKEWRFSNRGLNDNFMKIITFDENFEFFEMVPSGVYYLYVEGKPKDKVVEVCNCREKGERANHTYVQNIGGSENLYITLETIYTKTQDLDALTAGEYGSSGIGQVVETAKTKSVWLISLIEIVDRNGGKTYMKSVGDFPVDSYNKSSIKGRIPQLTDDGWKDETINTQENTVPQPSLARIYELKPKENAPYSSQDVFGIMPMFDEAYKKSSMDLSQIKDEEAKKMLKSMEDMSNAMGPLTDEMKKGMNEGEYKEKTKANTFTFQQLVNAAQGKGSISLNDKTVQRIETQVDGFQNMGSDTSRGLKKIGNEMPIGTDVQKGMNMAGKVVNGGIGNFVMTNHYNRPVTTTVTRQMVIRRATEAEIKEAGATSTQEILQQLPSDFYKSIKIVY